MADVDFSDLQIGLTINKETGEMYFPNPEEHNKFINAITKDQNLLQKFTENQIQALVHKHKQEHEYNKSRTKNSTDR